MHQKCTVLARRNPRDSTPAGRGEGMAMPVVTVSVKFENSDKVVELIEQLNDRNIDIDVDVDVELER